MKKIALFLCLNISSVLATDLQSYDVYLRDRELLNEDQASLGSDCLNNPNEACRALNAEFTKIQNKHLNFTANNDLSNFLLWAQTNGLKQTAAFAKKLMAKCDGVSLDIEYCQKQLNSFKEVVASSGLSQSKEKSINEFLKSFGNSLKIRKISQDQEIQHFSTLVSNFKNSILQTRNPIEVNLIKNEAIVETKSVINWNIFIPGILLAISLLAFGLNQLSFRKKQKNIQRKFNDYKTLFSSFFDYAKSNDSKIKFFSSGDLKIEFINSVESDIKRIIDSVGDYGSEIHFKLKQHNHIRSLEVVIFENHSFLEDKYKSLFESLDVIKEIDNIEAVIRNKLDSEGNSSLSSVCVTISD